MRAQRDLRAALRSLGARGTPIVRVSSVAPVTGIDELVEALEAHRAALDLPERRLRARRAAALADFVVEHGERGLRALGGRRSALRWLSEQDPGLDVPGLVGALTEKAGASS
jgi:LAO/AO transport system kinase